MGLMSKILGGRGTRSTADYLELDATDLDGAHEGARMQVHVAEIDDEQDAVAIKDAIYDGDLVIADITRLRTDDRTVDRIMDELGDVVEQVSGDIIQKGDDQLIIAPAGVAISREKLNER